METQKKKDFFGKIKNLPNKFLNIYVPRLPFKPYITQNAAPLCIKTKSSICQIGHFI